MSSLKYLVLAGPTAVGKTDLAIRLAQELQTEIVGGDAFQLYRGLDILTGKPTPAQLLTVPHHLVGILRLTDLCDAHRYASLARQTVADLNRQGRIPLVVGGTGFYLQALEGGIAELPPADCGLRAQLDQLSMPDLLRELETRDPEASNRIDRHNRRRVIRALEVCLLSGQPFSSFRPKIAPDPAIAGFILQCPKKLLWEKIDRRVDEMFERGVVAEVAAVDSIGATAAKAIGFHLIRSLIAGAINISSCVETMKQQTRSYAKRQMTWFRRQTYEIAAADASIDYLVATLRRRVLESGSG